MAKNKQTYRLTKIYHVEATADDGEQIMLELALTPDDAKYLRRQGIVVMAK